MNKPGPVVEAFFALLRSGLYGRPLGSEELTSVAALAAADWFVLARMAEEQAVPGLLYQAATLLPSGVKVPGDMVLDLMARCEEIAYENRRKAVLVQRLLARFKAQGLSPLQMKGASVAVYYPRPELRESGDIDFYFPPAELAAAQSCLSAPYRAPDGSLHGREGGVDIDLHDHYFDLHVPARRLPVPGSAEATILMLSAHILKHAIGTGIGIRQCCDLAAACRALEGAFDPAALKTYFHRTGTLRWNRLLFSFLVERLGLDEQIFAQIFGTARVASAPLLNIILEGGNFGHYAAARRDKIAAGTSHRKRDTLRRFLHRLPFSLRFAPRETFATIWTLIRGNLRRSQ